MQWGHTSKSEHMSIAGAEDMNGLGVIHGVLLCSSIHTTDIADTIIFEGEIALECESNDQTVVIMVLAEFFILESEASIKEGSAYLVTGQVLSVEHGMHLSGRNDLDQFDVLMTIITVCVYEICSMSVSVLLMFSV